jgi:hypothetical protein
MLTTLIARGLGLVALALACHHHRLLTRRTHGEE